VTARKLNIPQLLEIPENTAQLNTSRNSIIYRLSNIYVKTSPTAAPESTIYRFFSGAKTKTPDIFLHVVYPRHVPPSTVEGYIKDISKEMKKEPYYTSNLLPPDVQTFEIRRVPTTRNSVKKYHKVFPTKISTVKDLTASYEKTYGAKSQPNAFVFYLKSYFDPIGNGQAILNKLIRFVSSIPRVTFYNDTIYLQTSDQQYPSYKAALDAQPTLLAPDERKWSRKKVIATLSQVYTYGYGQFSCVIISQPIVQTNLKYLDASLFLASKDPFPWTTEDAKLFGHLYRPGENEDPWAKHTDDKVKFMSNAYYRNCLEDWSLALAAFNEIVPKISSTKKGFLRIPPMVVTPYVFSPDGKSSMKSLMQPIMIKALEDILQIVKYPNITGVELVGKDNLWRPTKQIPNYIYLHSDFEILDVQPILQKDYVVGVLNPSTSFALPGNKTDAGMESHIGDKTSIRFDQVYFLNPVLIDPNHFFGITVPITI